MNFLLFEQTLDHQEDVDFYADYNQEESDRDEFELDHDLSDYKTYLD